MRYWLFCRVIDNFGDAGVAWRLAKILQQEQAADIVLFIDNLKTLTYLNNTIQNNLSQQHCQSIQIIVWQENIIQDFLVTCISPHAVIELFACDLPQNIINYMMHNKIPIWLNLEYLSAEAWTEDYHLLPSLQKNHLQKYFYFLGFSKKSGGLIREYHYELHKKKFLQDKKQQEHFLNQYHIHTATDDEITIYCFAYFNENWIEHIRALQQSTQKILLWVSGSRLIKILQQAKIIDNQPINNTSIFHLDNIRIQQLPFIPQEAFDKLLFLADIAIIRGEESFSRANFSGTPFIWNIYPQQDHTHLVKLQAYWQQVYRLFPHTIIQAHQAISSDINQGDIISLEDKINAWTVLMNQSKQWQKAVQKWANQLLNQTSATERLASFIENKLK